MASQRIDLLQSEQVANAIASMSPVCTRSNRVDNSVFKIPVKEKSDNFQVRISGFDRAEFVGLAEMP